MSFKNLTTNETYPLQKDQPTFLGRHKFGIESRYISERQRTVFHFDQ